jgi:drug/metabolite transporter (DMT)-like permease
MKNPHLKHIFELLLATLFISTSGVLGKYIEMPPPVIVWWRSSLAMVFLYVYCKYKNINLKITSGKNIASFILGAVFMAAHWITYFYALKLSNVALGMLSLYTFPVITALLEPVFMKTKFNPMHIVLGLIVLLGIYILAPEFNLESSHVQGIGLGLISALCYSLRILIMKQHVAKYNGTMLMFYQVLLITTLLAPSLFLMDTSNIETQYPYVLLLALLTTAIGHTLMVKKFSYFSVSTASIISSVQPIFGIILAFFFLSEIPTLNTFLGGLLILSTVVIESVRSKKKP